MPSAVHALRAEAAAAALLPDVATMLVLCSVHERHARDRLANSSSRRTPPLCAVKLTAAFRGHWQPALHRQLGVHKLQPAAPNHASQGSSQHRSAALTWGPSRPESAGHGHGHAAWTAPSARATARACCAGQTRPQSAGTTSGDRRAGGPRQATAQATADRVARPNCFMLLSISGRLLRRAAHAAAFQSWRARC